MCKWMHCLDRIPTRRKVVLSILAVAMGFGLGVLIFGWPFTSGRAAISII